LARLPGDERETSLERYRPGTIPVIATFLFAATVIAFITGESLLFPNALLIACGNSIHRAQRYFIPSAEFQAYSCWPWVLGRSLLRGDY
jgi:hypothetical protein